MNVIHKFDLSSVPAVPVGAEILAVRVQRGRVVAWVSTDPAVCPPTAMRPLKIVETGDAVPQGRYLGTVQLDELVWHVFDSPHQWRWHVSRPFCECGYSEHAAFNVSYLLVRHEPRCRHAASGTETL